jgi:hypothetical protein
MLIRWSIVSMLAAGWGRVVAAQPAESCTYAARALAHRRFAR